MLVALPLILFCLAFLVIGCLRARQSDKPLPSVGELGFRVLRIQVLAFAAGFFIAPLAGLEVAVAVFYVAQALAMLVLLVHGLNVLLSRR